MFIERKFILFILKINKDREYLTFEEAIKYRFMNYI